MDQSHESSKLCRLRRVYGSVLHSSGPDSAFKLITHVLEPRLNMRRAGVLRAGGVADEALPH